MSYQFGQQPPLENSGAQPSNLLQSLMGFGGITAPQMSMASPQAVDPSLATYAPLSFTGDNGQVAALSGGVGGIAQNYGMSPISADMASPAAGGSDWWTKLMGGTAADGSKTVGALPVGLGAVQGLGSLFLGMQQYGLAKKQLAEGKRRYDQDYNAQKTLTNSRMEDRQRARVASNPGAYESIGNYMNKNGVR